MSFTLPKWTARDVPNWKPLLVKQPDGSVDINSVTEAVINYMPAIGITRLTKDNAHDAWCRIAMHQALLGTFYSHSDTGQPLFLTKKDVYRHIGMETEGNSKTLADFCVEIRGLAQHDDAVELPSWVANGGKSMFECLGMTDVE